MAWRSIRCSRAELCLDITLSCGQTFRWRKNNDVWTGALRDVVFSLKQTDSELQYICHNSSKASASEGFLIDYFNLSVDLEKLYRQWSSSDCNFARVADHFPGIRTLRQDPTETLFAFICSANNHIGRISAMMERLCTRFGKKLATVSGEDFFSFPAVEILSQSGVEEQLRQLGFGYRAKYVWKSAQQLLGAGGGSFLESLRTVSHAEAQQRLVQFSGVGTKVADCICLMALDKHAAIPVDTHVWQIASRDYMPHLAKHKTLTDGLRRQISKVFVQFFVNCSVCLSASSPYFRE